MRKFVPQLRKENMEANQPVLELLGSYAERKNVTMAQISYSEELNSLSQFEVIGLVTRILLCLLFALFLLL